MTVHAMEEMAEENLDIHDIEHALRSGKIARIEKDDPRGTKDEQNMLWRELL